MCAWMYACMDKGGAFHTGTEVSQAKDAEEFRQYKYIYTYIHRYIYIYIQEQRVLKRRKPRSSGSIYIYIDTYIHIYTGTEVSQAKDAEEFRQLVLASLPTGPVLGHHAAAAPGAFVFCNFGKSFKIQPEVYAHTLRGKLHDLR